MARPSIKVGPEMPTELPSVRADAPQGSPSVIPDVVRTTDQWGNVVETIMAVETPVTETREQIKARVKTSYIDTFGNLVETY